MLASARQGKSTLEHPGADQSCGHVWTNYRRLRVRKDGKELNSPFQSLDHLRQHALDQLKTMSQRKVLDYACIKGVKVSTFDSLDMSMMQEMSCAVFWTQLLTLVADSKPTTCGNPQDHGDWQCLAMLRWDLECFVMLCVGNC